MKYFNILTLCVFLLACDSTSRFIDCIDGCSNNKGEQGSKGSQGSKGDTGATGSNGLPGTPGINGTNGVNGQDGTSVVWIQFCPGSTSYPSTFIEGGFCINNNIYAVYSANDGFLTLVPPGTYHSSAIGSNCTFTVLPNCVIN